MCICYCNSGSESHKDDNRFECHCTPCRYPNGLIPLLVAQVLVMIAFTFSFFATFDCHFVTVDSNLVSGILDEIEPSPFDINGTIIITSNDTTRGLGFYFYEGINGECASRDTDYTEDIYTVYDDFLGSDWNVPTAMATWTTFLAFCWMIWLFCSSCIAQPKFLLYEMAVSLIVLFPIFQSIPFMILHSEFCSHYSCSMGRSARYAAGATILYAITGVSILFTKTYLKPEARNLGDSFTDDDDVQDVEAVSEKSVGVKANDLVEHRKDEENPETHEDDEKDNTVEANVSPSILALSLSFTRNKVK